MPVNPNKRLAILRRRQQVAELYLQSWSQAAIAERLQVDQSTISGDLKAIRREWRESAIRDFNQAQAEELQKIDRVEREAWAAWELSKKPSQSAVVDGDADSQQARKTIKNRHGDPRLLEVVLKCIVSRREILGLDAPTKIAPVMPDGQEPFRLAVAHLSLRELRALKRIRDRSLALIDVEANDDDSSSAD
jgi:hypothetical protein